MAKRKSPLMKSLTFFSPRERYADGWAEVSPYDRAWEKAYHQRWAHDKVVRSTHGVNCTGSCSWDIFVKDGIVTWENQKTDYPSPGPEMPDFEPRGCPRGATYSWYLYSPVRVKYPYVRSALLELWRQMLAETNDPVKAYEKIVENPEHSKKYKSARGKGGFVRVSWDDVLELI